MSAAPQRRTRRSAGAERRRRPGATPRARPAASDVRSGWALEGALLLLFFASGATSLVYETVWARRLQLLFGTSQLAVSTVLAAFMGGLAAGGFAGAWWARRTRRPLLAYAVLEGAIGLYALLFPALERWARALYLAYPIAPGSKPVGASLLEIVLALLLLLPPTACMGATLPLLAKVVAGARASVGSAIGRLYAANTVGAVAGTGLAGFALLPALGLRATTHWTVAANLVLALAAGWLALGGRGSAPDTADAAATGSAGARAPLARLLLLLAGLAGFTGLLYEVAWFRLMTLVLGGSAYSFSTMLLAFLLGIGLGGWPGGAAADRAWRRGGAAAVLRLLAWYQAGVGAASWVAMFAYGGLPTSWIRLYERADGAGPSLWIGQLALALGIMTVPALLMGASFPCLVRLASGDGEGAGRAAGVVYGANTLGAIAGALGGALLLLPALRVLGAVLFAAAVNMLVALIAMLAATPAWRRRRRLAPAAAAALAVLALGWLARPQWQPLRMTAGLFQYARFQGAGTLERMLERVSGATLLFYREGVSAVVTVAEHRDTGARWLATNGKVDASTDSDLKTQVLLGQLPLLLHPEPETVLVIGLASGITVGAVTLDPGPDRIDVAEIEPAMVTASGFFEQYNHRPLEDPRVRIYLDDARHQLLRAPDGFYDVVSSEPSNPWLSGVSNLFTLEFFQLGRRKLAPGGLWAQWIHTYGMAADDLRSLLSTFAAVYPEMSVFAVDVSDLILLGSDRPLDPSPASLRAALAASGAGEDLERVGILGPADILAHRVLDRERALELAGDVGFNTDDNMRIEYSAPLHLFEESSSANLRLLLDHATAAPTGSADFLADLARAYARLRWWDRALATLDAAEAAGAVDPSLAMLRFELMSAVARARAVEAP